MATNIKARRLLSDLFKEGTEIRFWTDPKTGKPTGKLGPFEDERGKRIPPKEGKEVAMFIRPPDPVQRDMAIRAGQAKRAGALVRAKRDEESEEHLTIMAFLADMSEKTLIDYVVLGNSAERHQEAEREILALEEWKDMTAYQDAMREYMEKSEEELEDDEEYQALLELDVKFGRQIAEREIELAEAQREALGFLPREEVEKQALARRAELVGSQAFMAEYERQMFYYSIRDPERIDQLFYENAEEVARQPDIVRDLIGQALLPYIADSGDAKNSLGAVSGLDSSALPEAPETSDSSTPKEQIA